MEPVKTLGKLDSSVLAEFILKQCGPLSHLKLQKLLYYTESLHLAFFSQSLIDDEFEAWLHGPVSRKIYDQLKDKSILYNEMTWVETANSSNPEDVLRDSLTQDQFDLVNEILTNYSALSAIQLEDLSHSEDPWICARKGYGPFERCNVVIPKQHMADYYKGQLYGA